LGSIPDSFFFEFKYSNVVVVGRSFGVFFAGVN
jgi:hypothetical protein